MIKIVRTDRELECPLIDAELRRIGANLVLLPEGISEVDLIAETQDADLILMCYTPITARVIESARKLKGVVKYGVGIDAVDIEAAIARQIPVVNIPEYAERTVAEGAFCLLIALAKKLIPMNGAMQQQGWLWPTAQWLGADISEKTIGLVGLGRIGQSMARIAGAGFGAHVLAYDPNVSEQKMRAEGVTKHETLTGMLAECDFVSIHCVLNRHTKHLIGELELRAMKSSAFLINVSRGAIVDETALKAALLEGRIAGAGLDVYSQEPLALADHPLSQLFGMQNVIVLPHLTFYTAEAMQRLEEETLTRCLEILENRPTSIKSTDPRLRAQRHGVCFDC